MSKKPMHIGQTIEVLPAKEKGIVMETTFTRRQMLKLLAAASVQ